MPSNRDDLTESIRFWRTRFILIPLEVIPQSTLSSLNPANENLNEEELRLAGFTKFLELFHKARWIDPSERHGQPPSKKGVHSGSNIPITFTTFQTSTYIANEVTAWRRARGGETAGATLPGTSAVSAPMGWLKRDVELPELARAMLHAVTGLSVKDRRWHLRFYERVLIGSECVDWLVRSFADINTREEAEEFGNVLLNTGFFDHVNKKHRFLDGHYFYRLSKEYSGASGAPSASGAAPSQTYATGDPREDKSPMRWFRSTTASSRNGIDAGQEETAALTMEPILATAATPSLSITSAQERSRFAASQRSIPRFELSRKMVIDLDPQMKSSRKG